MQPIGRYILVKQLKEQVTTESGIVLSSEDVSNMRYQKAEVFKVGTDVEGVTDGVTIYYDRSSGHSMMINNEIYTVIQQRDVVIVL
jgi:co-chaperonin GroES (HSP10)